MVVDERTVINDYDDGSTDDDDDDDDGDDDGDDYDDDRTRSNGTEWRGKRKSMRILWVRSVHPVFMGDDGAILLHTATTHRPVSHIIASHWRPFTRLGPPVVAYIYDYAR